MIMDIDGQLIETRQLIEYVERVNKKWRSDLPKIDPVLRPVGYENQLRGIAQQERTLKRLRERASRLERKINKLNNNDNGERATSPELFSQE